jgi:lactate dehydrogenase-like 2-hydroxyacid dehydrogenase
MPGTLFISRRLPEEALVLARSRATVRLHPEDRRLGRDELARYLGDADAMVCLLTDTIDDELLARAPRLRIVANVAVGYDNIDVPAATRRKILVTNTPGVLTETTADFTWALLLAAARRVVEADAYTRAGKFTQWGLMLLLGVDVHGKTLGILGLGRIGLAVARRARGFSMTLLYHDAIRDHAAERDLGIVYQDKDTVLRDADFVTLHVPLLPETRHYIGEPELRRMKRTAFLVNASRGPIVHEAALAQALREGWIAGAGLDVYEDEPAIHPGLLECPNAVLAPHIASASRETRTRMATMAVENCLAVLEGNRPPNAVNSEVLTR